MSDLVDFVQSKIVFLKISGHILSSKKNVTLFMPICQTLAWAVSKKRKFSNLPKNKSERALHKRTFKITKRQNYIFDNF